MSKPRIPYFDFYPADFMHGIRGLTAQEVGIYTMLLCRIYEENGPVEYHPARLATYCGSRESTFVKAFDRLVDLGKLVVTDGCFMNPRAEREIESRKSKLENNSRAGKISAEKKQQKQAGASTTVQRAVNHTDTDTDTVEKEEANASSKKRGSRLTAEWQLPKTWGEWAVSEGLADPEVRIEADKFRDYWTSTAGKSAVKLDWQATWRNWVRKAISDRSRTGFRAISGGKSAWTNGDLRINRDHVQEFYFGHWERRNDLTPTEVEAHPRLVARLG